MSVTLILKYLNIKKYTYHVDSEYYILRARLENFFNRKINGTGRILNGEFISQDVFSLSRKFYLFGNKVSSFESDFAYLRGTIEHKEEKLKIRIRLRPNLIFIIFGLLCPIVGLIAMIYNLFIDKSYDNLIVGIIFVGIGIIMYLIGDFCTDSLCGDFEKHFNLKR